MITNLLTDLKQLNSTNKKIISIIEKYDNLVKSEEFVIRLPIETISCNGFWEPKKESTIFVQEESHIEPLFQALVEQDDYWQNYKHLIQIYQPIYCIDIFCSNAGKTDIYDVKKLKTDMSKLNIQFIIYQQLTNQTI